MRALSSLLVLLAGAEAARAERLVSQLSTDLIEITSSYSGERITIFGNVEPDVGAADTPVEGPLHAIIVVTGPTMDRLAREKTRQLGIWLNTDEVAFPAFPSFYQVMASGRLSDIAPSEILEDLRILPEAQPGVPAGVEMEKAALFGTELVRLMGERGFFGLSETGVNFLSNTAYSARMVLPSDAPPGPYLATTYIFRDGELVVRRAEGFAVRKTGFERFVAITATQQPLLYGLACVVLALFSGWLGGVIFRR